MLVFEAGHHARAMMLGDDRLVGVVADDHAYVPGAEEAIDANVRLAQQRLHGRQEQLVGGEDREVLQRRSARLADGQGCGGGCRLEPDAQEDHVLVGIGPGDRHGLMGGVEGGHVRPGGAGLLERAVAPPQIKRAHLGHDIGGDQHHDLVEARLRALVFRHHLAQATEHLSWSTN